MRRFLSDGARTAEYIAAVEAMGRLSPDHAHRAWAEATSEASMKAWATRYGVNRSSGHICIQRVIGKNCKYRGVIGKSCMPPMADHCSLWLKGGKPYVFVSQPYPSSAIDLVVAFEFARENKLALRIGTWPSWHFPGSVLMMEYFRDPGHEVVAVGP